MVERRQRRKIMQLEIASIPRGQVLLVVPAVQIRTAHHPHHLVAQEATAVAAEVIDRIPHRPTLTKVVEDNGVGPSRGVVIVEDEELTALLLAVAEVTAVAATPHDRRMMMMMMMTRKSVPRQGRVRRQTKIMLATACVGPVQE
jgi:hypothetical protein